MKKTGIKLLSALTVVLMTGMLYISASEGTFRAERAESSADGADFAVSEMDISDLNAEEKNVSSAEGEPLAADVPESEAEPSEKDSSLFDSIENILGRARSAFIGNHPVDESFLFWVADSFGEDVIRDIAAQVELKAPDIWKEKTGESIHVLYDDYCRKTGLSYYSQARKKTLPSSEKKDDEPVITMDFTGDICFAENLATTGYMDLCEYGLSDCFSADLLSEMRNCDVLTVNNEFAYTDRGEAIEGKAFTFRADPSRVNELRKIGADLVNLANNHVFDYGETGLLDTLDTLDRAGFPHIGAGKDLSEASEGYSFSAGGQKITIVSATQIERSYNYTREATDSLPGVLKTLHPEKFLKVIRNAKKTSDIVIVFVHWGTEGNASYGADQVALAEAFVDAGADAIIGGHTHCLEGIEYIGDVPVYYSLGNYWFSSTEKMPGRYDTGLARLEIGKDGNIKASFIPCYFENGVTSMITKEDERTAFFSRLSKLSKTTDIDMNGVITKKKGELP